MVDHYDFMSLFLPGREFDVFLSDKNEISATTPICHQDTAQLDDIKVFAEPPILIQNHEFKCDVDEQVAEKRVHETVSNDTTPGTKEPKGNNK